VVSVRRPQTAKVEVHDYRDTNVALLDRMQGNRRRFSPAISASPTPDTPTSDLDRVANPTVIEGLL
jgi:hypothetical protein